MLSLPVYVINMDRSVCRWRRCSEQLDELNIQYTRISAVDGDDIDENELRFHVKSKGILYRWIRDITSAELGCCLSHRKVWERVKAEGHDGAFVLEDDIIAGVALPGIMDIISNLQIGPPVLIKLYMPDANATLNRVDMGVPLIGEHVLALQAYGQWGTLAYYINRAGAERLLDSVNRMHRPIDDILRRTWSTGVVVLHVIPCPVRHDDGPSIIGRSRAGMFGNRLYLDVFGKEYRMMNKLHRPARLIRARRIFSGIRDHYEGFQFRGGCS